MSIRKKTKTKQKKTILSPRSTDPPRKLFPSGRAATHIKRPGSLSNLRLVNLSVAVLAAQ